MSKFVTRMIINVVLLMVLVVVSSGANKYKDQAWRQYQPPQKNLQDTTYYDVIGANSNLNNEDCSHRLTECNSTLITYFHTKRKLTKDFEILNKEREILANKRQDLVNEIWKLEYQVTNPKDVTPCIREERVFCAALRPIRHSIETFGFGSCRSKLANCEDQKTKAMNYIFEREDTNRNSIAVNEAIKNENKKLIGVIKNFYLQLNTKYRNQVQLYRKQQRQPANENQPDNFNQL